MARLIHGVPASPLPRRADPLTDLTLLLSRLQRTILHADAEREARLRESEFEREKARANINYARSLLTKLEQEALAVKIHSRRQETQAALVRQREVLDQLSDRLSDLYELAAAGNNADGEEDTSDGEDILADIIATPSESLDSTRSPDGPSDEPSQDSESLDHIPPTFNEPEKPPQPSQQPTPSPAPHSTTTTTAPATTAIASTTTTTTTTQTLRSRQPNPSSSSSHPPTQAQPPPKPTATTTSSSLLPTTTTSPSTTAPIPIPTTQEALLDHHRAEQDALSDSILQLAAQLKASSQAFSAALDEDKNVVDRAGKGMGKAGETMEAVSRRMGALTRMTEGEGWWGRMRLYAIVYGLMVVLVLVVGVGPKLRF